MKINSDGLYIIGEIASSHQGNIKNLYQLVDAVVDSKADCVQVQIFNLEANASKKSKNYEALKNLEIPLLEWFKVLKYIEKKQIEYSVFTYDEPSLNFVLENFNPDLIKFSSSELSNPNMLNHISKYKKIPLNLGIGGSSIDEIKRALTFLYNRGYKNIFLAHGVQNFPTEIENINFSKLKKLMHIFDIDFIYCDHTDYRSINHQFIDYIALGLGIKIFEKHIILKNNPSLIDNESSLDILKFKSYVENLRLVNQSLISNKSVEKSEKQYREFQKKSTFSNKDLIKDESLTINDVTYKRDVGNKEGIDPFDFNENYLGKKINKNIKKNTKLTKDDF